VFRELRKLPQVWSKAAKLQHLKQMVEHKTQQVIPTDAIAKLIARS
jgi:hypothetical protein